MASLALNGGIMLQNVYTKLLGNIHVLVLYPIIYSSGICGIEGRNNGHGKIPLKQWCQWNLQPQ